MSMHRISTLGRFYLYTIHGYVTEIMFTALWEFVVSWNWKFPGVTSIWSGPIYGCTCLIMERLCQILVAKGVPLPLRCLCYTFLTYICEFSTGFVLKQFGACPWDYTPFHGDFMGLVTLEYAPCWYFASMGNEVFLMYYFQRMFIDHTSNEDEKKGPIYSGTSTVAENLHKNGIPPKKVIKKRE